ncbi:PREDICTED: WPP domain-interacting tail-anchored protein 1-like isoform X2 [Tarenaya hassleriana]|uniref:WPP domain-interacting tail-anchored protein 1-like isoform X2 n=1 Tax=Tarenaya hassleriana TaxID=28532 RepID=UPI00053C767C|nr:PREDICTED: WPP domain-interacting tail-anchored protein 1-like isoform X2 [Tarenaya hassleriana]
MDITHERTVSVDDDVGSLVPELSSTKTSHLEEVMNQELFRAGRILTRVELDLACCSEKLVNLSVLTMHLGARESDFESFASEKVPSGIDSAEKAMEFDLLSAICDSEVNELENLIKHLQTEIQGASDMISPFQDVEEAFSEMLEKLRDAEQASRESLNQVLEMKIQSANFQRISSGAGGQAGEFQHDGEFGDMSFKIKMQTADQQRNFLRMLEKSLAKEMELEKKLTESRQTEKELRMKLYSSEQDVFYMEEEAQEAYLRWFEADNAAEVFKGTSKELSGKLQILQFNLSGSFKREDNLKSELMDSKERLEAKESVLQKLDSSNTRVHDFLMAQAEGLKESLREAEDKLVLFESENMTLRETISSLEEQLKEYELQAKDSVCGSQQQDRRDLECNVEELKEKLTKAEARIVDAESKSKQLNESDKELSDELELFKAKGLTVEKLESVEKRLRDSDIQLEHAMAAVEASQEKQNLLIATVSDMGNVIEDLKLKVLRAENRADSAKDKLIVVSDYNTELNEEVKFLRGRLKELEQSLHQAEEVKTQTAKDIGVRNKIMRNLVMQLAVERERIHRQISTLSVENSVLVANLRQAGKRDGFPQKPDQSSAVSHDRGSRSRDTVTSATSSEGERMRGSDASSVRRLDAGALGFKRIVLAILVLILSAAAYSSLRPDPPF